MANCGLRVKPGPFIVVNKVLLACSAARSFLCCLWLLSLPQWPSGVVVPGTRASPRVQCFDSLALEEAACLLQKKVCVSLIFLSSVESAKKETVLNDSAVF